MKQKLLFTLGFLISVVFSSKAQLTNRQVADQWLVKESNDLFVQPYHSFDMLFSRQGLSGETFRYYQMINDVQVFDAEITIHVSNSKDVTFTANTYKRAVANISTIPVITENDALQIALSNLNVVNANLIENKNKLFVLQHNDETLLVYRVFVYAYGKEGAWEVMVNAQTGAVVYSMDIAVYHKPKHEKDKNKTHNKEQETISVPTTGTGFIFDTDPLTAAQVAYGGQYVDGNDATNASLDAARSLVNLQEIDLTGGQYRLRNNFVEIAELSSPNKGLFIQASPNFQFNRQQDGFEAVNVFYHVDKSMRYINTNLNITLAPPQNGGVIRYDPHGANGADNSYYTSGTLNFGEGCVDDGEDADVILHELGHGLHDWITNGGLSQVNGLSEGSGDYWANSYKRSLGLWSNTDAARNWVFGWDGHNSCWNGRTTVYGAQYPGGLVNQIHTDGQMCATTLMEIWEDIGRTKTDKAFLEGLGMTNSGTNQQNAAIAVRQAAIDMGTAHGYTCADIQAMTDRFTAQGYTMPAYTCNLSVAEFDINSISIYPNPTSTSISFKNIKEKYSLSILNILGQVVLEANISPDSNEINVAPLKSGAYFIKFKGVDKALKFIKN